MTVFEEITTEDTEDTEILFITTTSLFLRLCTKYIPKKGIVIPSAGVGARNLLLVSITSRFLTSEDWVHNDGGEVITTENTENI